MAGKEEALGGGHPEADTESEEERGEGSLQASRSRGGGRHHDAWWGADQDGAAVDDTVQDGNEIVVSDGDEAGEGGPGGIEGDGASDPAVEGGAGAGGVSGVPGDETSSNSAGSMPGSSVVVGINPAVHQPVTVALSRVQAGKEAALVQEQKAAMHAGLREAERGDSDRGLRSLVLAGNKSFKVSGAGMTLGCLAGIPLTGMD